MFEIKNVDLYEGNAWFESQPGHRLSSLRVLSSQFPSRKRLRC